MLYSSMAVAAVMAVAFTSNALGQAKPKAPESDRIKRIETRLDLIERQVSNRRPGFATPDCDAKKYANVQTDDPGKFLLLVSCENVEPYLEGYRLTFHIGNPYQVHFHLKGKLYYADFSKNTEVPLVDGLGPGQWTRAIVNISQAQASDFRHLYLEFFVESVRLAGPSLR